MRSWCDDLNVDLGNVKTHSPFFVLQTGTQRWKLQDIPTVSVLQADLVKSKSQLVMQCHRGLIEFVVLLPDVDLMTVT